MTSGADIVLTFSENVFLQVPPYRTGNGTGYGTVPLRTGTVRAYRNVPYRYAYRIVPYRTVP